MIRKRRHTRRNYQVLRENESPQGVNCIFYRSAERLTRLCGAGAPFLPLFLTPFRRSLFRGTEDFPNHHGGPKTLRQPRKYRRINGSCQLDSIRKINPRGWPIPCCPRRRLQPELAPASLSLLRVLSNSPPGDIRADSVRRELLETGKGLRNRASIIHPIDYKRLMVATHPGARPIPSPDLIASVPFPLNRCAKPFHHCVRPEPVLLYRISQRTYTAYV